MTQSKAIAHYGRKHKLLTIVLAILNIGLITFVVAAEGVRPDRSLGPLIGLMLILGIPLPLMVLEVWFVRVEVTAAAIHCHSPWRTARVIPLTEISRVDFAMLPQWFRIHTNAHGIVRLHGYLRGLYDVLEVIEAFGHPYPRVHHAR